MKLVWAILPLALMAVFGCQSTGTNVLSVPVARDSGTFPPGDIDKAAALVGEAGRAGAAYYAPYEYYSALRYLAIAGQKKRAASRSAFRDYAQLAATMAEAALAKAPAPEDNEPMPRPRSRDECMALFQKLLTRYQHLDDQKAKEVAPVIYANLTADLSLAESELIAESAWRAAADALVRVAPAIDTIRAQDTDDDGIPDMSDAAPLLAEDFDGFEDDDGAPDPDNDADGVPDTVDTAPMAKETINSWRDDDGAPDAYPALDVLHFESGSTRISSDAKGYLRGVGIILRESPRLHLRIAGHTDDAHSDTYNLDLSKRRAEKVQEYLKEQGVPSAQLVVTYHGAEDPVADNSTAQGRLLNRRVSLRFE